MNIYQVHLLVVVFSVFISLALAIAPVWPFDQPEPEATEPQQPQPPEETDAVGTLEALERETFREITEQQLMQENRQYTPKKCCKIGKKVADKGLYCHIDLMQVEKKNNNVYRRKMKFQGAEAGLSSSDLAYKSLLQRVEKCFPNKASRSMFSKCCEWQQQLSIDVENCKYLRSREARRECKQRVRAREGR